MLNIARQRLLNQQIASSTFTTAADLVAWFGAIQAQDYLAAKWALGLRLPGATDTFIEEAITDRSVVRTWALRGTLHLVAAADVRWMLNLINKRFQVAYGTYFRKLELTESVLAKGREAIVGALHGGKQLTRPELKVALEGAGFSTQEQRLNHFLVWAAINGIICCGCRRGKEFTYTLLDEWLPVTNELNTEEALAELTTRYFSSHGPATLADFVWWSGLTVAEAKTGLDLTQDRLSLEIVAGQPHWQASSKPTQDDALGQIHLLPSFDEYLVAYKDRGAALGSLALSQIVSAGNGLFNPVIVSDGQVVGTWKRTIKNDQIRVETSFLLPVAGECAHLLEAEIERYRAFLTGHY